MEQEQKPRERSFIRELVPDWRPTREQGVWAVRIAVVVAVTLLGILALLWVISVLIGVELMALLKVLAVPITVGAAVPLLNWLQKKHELEVEHERNQGEMLRAYLDYMSQMLTDKQRPLYRASPDDNLSTAARARTLTVLSGLDAQGKRSVVLFLVESGLVTNGRAVIDLNGADLREANLIFADCRGAKLSGANLSRAELRFTSLQDADLRHAYLSVPT
jgi:pentapeptide repeat protein